MNIICQFDDTLVWLSYMYSETSLIGQPPGTKNVGINNEVALLLMRLKSTSELCVGPT